MPQCPDTGRKGFEIGMDQKKKSVPNTFSEEEHLEQAEKDSLRPEIEESTSLTEEEAERKAKLASIDWEAALRENENWLRTIIAARVGERAAVEEVFQEVSLATIRQKAPLQDPTKISPWLYRIAVMQSLLYRRKMGRKRRLMDRYTEKVTNAGQDSKQEEPLSWLLREERRAHVQQALAELPKNQQELLLLKYVHDWSYKMMADKIGTTVSAVQAKLHRARALLREKLNRMNIDS